MGIVELKDVSRVYRNGDHEQRALDHVDLSLEEGKFIVVLGPSGSLCWRAIWCRRLAPPENRWQAGGIGMILLLAAAVLWYSKGTKKK